MYRTNKTMIIMNIVIVIITIATLWEPVHLFIEEMKTAGNERTTTKTELAAIAVDSQVEGRFFRMGRGSIEQEEYFVAYKINEDKSKSLYKIPAENTYIYETLKENEGAYVEEIKNGYGTVLRRNLFVPEKTIWQEYDLSLDL